jgi:hypothetical protein
MTKSKPSWKDLKSIIETFSQQQLHGLIRDLYQLSPENKEFLHARFMSKGRPNRDDLKPYMDRIRIAVSPREPWNEDVSLSAGRKAIRDFKKANGDKSATLELMLYYVRCGNDFTLEFGDIDGPFYDSMLSMFGSIVTTLIRLNDPSLTHEFAPKLITEFERIDGKMGWGYADGMKDWLDELPVA